MATTSEAEQHDANIQAPRRGEIMAQAVDATARAIDMKLLSFNGQPFNASQKEYVFVTLTNESATTTVYYYFSQTNDTTGMDPAAVVSAGGAPSLRTSDPWPLYPLQKEPVHLQRDLDKFLIVRTASGTATLRIGTSSHSTKQQL